MLGLMQREKKTMMMTRCGAATAAGNDDDDGDDNDEEDMEEDADDGDGESSNFMIVSIDAVFNWQHHAMPSHFQSSHAHTYTRRPWSSPDWPLMISLIKGAVRLRATAGNQACDFLPSPPT